MITAQLQVSGGFNLPDLSLNRSDMRNLMQTGVDAVKGRVAQGTGSEGQEMPALNKRYITQKRRAGQPAIRNLSLTGSMLDNLTVRSADANRAVAALTSNKDRTKAYANEQISPWLGFSPADSQKVSERASDMLAQKMESASKA